MFFIFIYIFVSVAHQNNTVPAMSLDTRNVIIKNRHFIQLNITKNYIQISSLRFGVNVFVAQVQLMCLM